MRRASSNTTINSNPLQAQVYTDPDIMPATPDSQTVKPQKRPRIFGGPNRNNTPTKTSGKSSTPGTPTSTGPSPPGSSASHTDSTTSLVDKNETPVNASASATSNNRRNVRPPTDQTLPVNSRLKAINAKPDRRKDIKLTNCQEKDGIWTATGQFGRESRHSKRADITYDKKKFRFVQRDDQGNKHVFEIPASEVEGKSYFHEFSAILFLFLRRSVSIVVQFGEEWRV